MTRQFQVTTTITISDLEVDGETVWTFEGSQEGSRWEFYQYPFRGVREWHARYFSSEISEEEFDDTLTATTLAECIEYAINSPQPCENPVRVSELKGAENATSV